MIKITKQFHALIYSAAALFLLCGCTQTSHIPATAATSEASSTTIAEAQDQTLPQENAYEPSGTTVSEAEESTEYTYMLCSPVDITFIDVGQGDSILIEDAGQTMLIDTGRYFAYDQLEAVFRERGISGIDVLVLTHPDADHIQSAPEIISYYGAQTVYMSATGKDSSSYGYLMNAIDTFDVNVIYPQAGDIIPFGTATYTVLGPVQNKEGIYEDVNSSSLIIKMVNGNDSFLFTGDATGEETEDILAAGYDVSASVYKAAHHGSANHGCNSERFINAVDPYTSVISCGYGNDYGHPHIETMELFQKRGIAIFRTDLQGTISCTSTGEEILWDTSPSENYANGNSL